MPLQSAIPSPHLQSAIPLPRLQIAIPLPRLQGAIPLPRLQSLPRKVHAHPARRHKQKAGETHDGSLKT
jgi:hypothetical protein